MRGRRAQFFILAAVILSAIIISFGVISNRATINREPKNFYDYTFEVKKESGAVMDWELYSDFDSGENLTKFVDLLASDTMDKYPDANFLFVYGNSDSLVLRNYGVNDAAANGEDVVAGGRPVVSGISYGTSFTGVSTPQSSYGDWDETVIITFGEAPLEIEIADQDYDFQVSSDNQVLFVIQRNIDGESYVAVE